jgi:hypothetical protein
MLKKSSAFFLNTDVDLPPILSSNVKGETVARADSMRETGGHAKRANFAATICIVWAHRVHYCNMLQFIKFLLQQSKPERVSEGIVLGNRTG